MEKKIVLTMHSSKDITVSLNEHKKMTIEKDRRTVKADDIYNLLRYERGDTYNIESVNEENVDVPVLHFFTELFQDITDRLNRLTEKQNDDGDVGQEKAVKDVSEVK